LDLSDVGNWIYLMLAVANSSLSTTFYDTAFHNKLYAGRRRFMTQYVKAFPLPDLESPSAREAVAVAKELVAAPTKTDEARTERLVLKCFGL
jgi:hypothetical protein